MTARQLTILTCDGCQSEADERFTDPADTDPWMHAHGWASDNGRDLCPACLMDHDATAAA